MWTDLLTALGIYGSAMAALGGLAFYLHLVTGVLLLPGCADRDAVMGRTAGTPVPEPAQNSVHCDLIFPGTDRR